MQNASTRKETAISFLKLAAAGKLDEAYHHASTDFRHHNPHFGGDAESLKAGMAEAAEKFPNTTLDVQHTVAEGDFVAVHSRVSHGPDQTDIAVVHIFRFKGEQIAELWDVGIQAPQDSPNENGMF